MEKKGKVTMVRLTANPDRCEMTVLLDDRYGTVVIPCRPEEARRVGEAIVLKLEVVEEVNTHEEEERT